MANKLRKLIEQRDYIEILREVFAGYNTLNWYLGMGEYEKLMRYCDIRLDYEPQNAYLYFAELFAECEINRLEDLIFIHYLTTKQSFKVARRFGDENLAVLLDFIENQNRSWRRTIEEENWGLQFRDDGRTLLPFIRTKEYFKFRNKDVYIVPYGVNKIAANTFNYYGFGDVIIPESVKKIGYNAFGKASSVILEPGNRNYFMDENGGLYERATKRLLSVNAYAKTPFQIPDWLMEIDSTAIPPYITVEISPDHPHFLQQDGILISTSTRKILHITPEMPTCCWVPDGVTEIPPYAFMPFKRDSSKLVSIVLTDSIQWIDECAFYNCEKLKNLIMPNELLSIGEEAFCCCRRLEKLILPQKLQYIGAEAFRYCSSLTSLVIPPNVTTIGDNAFADCAKLKRVEVLSKNIKIGASAFAKCPELDTFLILPGCYEIHNDTFKDCPKLDTSFLDPPKTE